MTILHKPSIALAIRNAGRKANKVDEYLNCGGCGIFAEALYAEMYKVGCRDMAIRLFTERSNCDVDVSAVERALLNDPSFDGISAHPFWDRGCSFSHVVIDWNDSFWDSTGKLESKEEWGWCYAAQNGSLSFNVLRGVNSIQPNWNTRFNRDNIDKVRDAVASAFKWVIP